MVTLILLKIRKAQKHDCSIVRNDSKYVRTGDSAHIYKETGQKIWPVSLGYARANLY